jgi:hypothetical protein
LSIEEEFTSLNIGGQTNTGEIVRPEAIAEAIEKASATWTTRSDAEPESVWIAERISVNTSLSYQEVLKETQLK